VKLKPGNVHSLVHDSKALQDNPLGDPSVRDVLVYTPPNWDSKTPLPALFALPAFCGTAWGFLNRRWRDESLPERMDRLVAAGMPPMLVVIPDSITAVGGSQYLDSPGIGAYQEWITVELKAFIEERYPTTGAWGAIGKSSGAYGALVMAMQRPGCFRAIAAHSPDAGFEYCYPPDFPGAVEAIRTAGGVSSWWGEFLQGGPLRGAQHSVINLLGMSCAYSFQPGVEPLPCDLPVDLETGATRAEVFERWLELDPVRMAVESKDALEQLNGIWLDVGRKDEFRLQVGARLLHDELEALNVSHQFLEHPRGHFKLDHRFDHSLPFLAERLSV